MPIPKAGEHPPHFDRYINQVTDDDCVKALQSSLEPLKQFLATIPETQANHAYEPGKWPVKQLLQHCIDAERIFGYRALCISRGEQQSLPGFDENEYADHANAANRTISSLVGEFVTLRQSTIDLFSSFTNDQLNAIGMNNNHAAKANSFGFIILGHWFHHKKILNERYGI